MTEDRAELAAARRAYAAAELAVVDAVRAVRGATGPGTRWATKRREWARLDAANAAEAEAAERLRAALGVDR